MEPLEHFQLPRPSFPSPTPPPNYKLIYFSTWGFVCLHDYNKWGKALQAVGISPREVVYIIKPWSSWTWLLCCATHSCIWSNCKAASHISSNCSIRWLLNPPPSLPMVTWRFASSTTTWLPSLTPPVSVLLKTHFPWLKLSYSYCSVFCLLDIGCCCCCC